MSKILLTGACGFIGSHLTEYLIKEGHDVVAFDRYNSNIIKDINYTSRDLKGNEYILVAKEGEIDLNNSDIRTYFHFCIILYINL